MRRAADTVCSVSSSRQRIEVRGNRAYGETEYRLFYAVSSWNGLLLCLDADTIIIAAGSQPRCAIYRKCLTTPLYPRPNGTDGKRRIPSRLSPPVGQTLALRNGRHAYSSSRHLRAPLAPDGLFTTLLSVRATQECPRGAGLRCSLDSTRLDRAWMGDDSGHSISRDIPLCYPLWCLYSLG
ncbi:hypothetical protein MRB53_036995 [Persea americana]|nr:hypothetical protein MRB53_036995 [Persea americana]